jgi:hypothetical protein
MVWKNVWKDGWPRSEKVYPCHACGRSFPAAFMFMYPIGVILCTYCAAGAPGVPVKHFTPAMLKKKPQFAFLLGRQPDDHGDQPDPTSPTI